MGESLSNNSQVEEITALVSDDYGIIVNGLRYESPDLAAQAISGDLNTDGWNYWFARSRGGKSVSLATLRTLNQ